MSQLVFGHIILDLGPDWGLVVYGHLVFHVFPWRFCREHLEIRQTVLTKSYVQHFVTRSQILTEKKIEERNLRFLRAVAQLKKVSPWTIIVEEINMRLA